MLPFESHQVTHQTRSKNPIHNLEHSGTAGRLPSVPSRNARLHQEVPESTGDGEAPEQAAPPEGGGARREDPPHALDRPKGWQGGRGIPTGS